jgi:hypothetical protein
MTQSDWLMPRGAVAHQGVFISSKKVPYGAGLTPDADGPTHHRHRTDGESFRPSTSYFQRGVSLFSPFAIHISTDPTGLTCRLGQGVSPCRTSTSVVQRHVGLRQIGREGEARASSSGWTNGEEARTVGPVVFRRGCYQLDGSRLVSTGLVLLPGPLRICLLHFASSSSFSPFSAALHTLTTLTASFL